MHIVAFNGSPRPEGNTFRLIKAALGELEREGATTELVQIGGKPLSGCRACGACGKNKDRRCAISDEINDHIAKMIAADAILLGSPTYFADITPELKALIDRTGFVSRMNDGLLRRKVGAAIVAARRGGAIHAFDTINHFFLIGEMIIAGSNYWNVGLGRAPGEVEQDAEGMETMRILGRNIAWLLARIKGER